jgi:hypothetical protein
LIGFQGIWPVALKALECAPSLPPGGSASIKKTPQWGPGHLLYAADRYAGDHLNMLGPR